MTNEVTPPEGLSDIWLTVLEVAEYCKVSRSSVNRWRKQEVNPLIFVKNNGFLRCNKNDLLRFLIAIRGERNNT